MIKGGMLPRHVQESTFKKQSLEKKTEGSEISGLCSTEHFFFFCFTVYRIKVERKESTEVSI